MKDKGAFTIKRKVNFSKRDSTAANKQMLSELVGDEVELVASPGSIIFHNYESDHVHINKFTVRNNSRKPIAYRIVEPASIAFRLKAEYKGEVPEGDSFEVYVYFKNIAKENNTIYADRVYINHANGSLEVPVSALPPRDHKKVSLILHEDELLGKSVTTIKKRLASGNIMGSSRQSTFTKSISQSQVILSEFDSIKECLIEHQFCKRFKDLTVFMKDKNMKVESFIGNQQLEQSYIKSLTSSREQASLEKSNNQKNLIRNRFKIEFLDECPIIDRGQNKIVRWNQSVNDVKRIKNNGIKKLLACVRKYITSFRVERAKQAWQKYVAMEGTTQTIMETVLADIDLMRKARQKMDVKIDMVFSSKSFQIIGFPCELSKIDTPPAYNGGNFYFQVNPRIGFDDWIPMEELAENYQQIMKYENESYPSIYEYIPIKADRTARTGAQNQYACPCFDQHEDFSSLSMMSAIQPELQTPPSLASYSQPQEPEHPLCLLPSQCPYEPSPCEPLLGTSSANLSSRTFTPLSFQLFHYIKPQPQNQYDCCFESHIESHVDFMIGTPELDDKRNLEEEGYNVEDILELEINTLEEENRLREQLYSEEEFIGGEMHHHHTVTTAIENQLENYKLEKLKIPNAHIRSVNKFIRQKEFKLIF